MKASKEKVTILEETVYVIHSNYHPSRQFKYVSTLRKFDLCLYQSEQLGYAEIANTP